MMMITNKQMRMTQHEHS